MNPFFSIIIPVYNGVSHDLQSCLASIWSQPLEKQLYEVICVDDCSKDGTRQWLEEEKRKHNNLSVVFNKENVRQGGRNNGVKCAKGEYLLFIDQDDYYHDGALAKVFDFLQHNKVDVLVSDSAYQFKGFESNELQLNFQNCTCMTGEQFALVNGFVFAPWRMCINRNFYIKHDFRFPEKVRIEDVDWAIKVTYLAPKMQYQPILLIHYNKAENGTTDNMYRDLNTLLDNVQAGNRVLALANTLCKNSKISEKVEDCADLYYDFSCKYMLGLSCKPKEKRKIIDSILENDGKRKFVKLALRHRILYSYISCVSVPLYRGIRYLKRRIEAKKRMSHQKGVL